MTEATATILADPGTAPPAAAAVVPPVTPATAPPATVPDWAKEYTPDVQEWVTKSNFKTPADLASAALATKKLVGHDPNDVLVKPKDGDSEGLRKVMQSLGVPDTPEKYSFKLADEVKALVPAENLTAFSKLAHEHMLTPAQAQALLDFDVKRATDAQGAADKTWADKSTADYNELKTSWGDAFGTHVEAARRGAEAAGLTLEQRTAIERAIGLKAAAEAFVKIGKPLMETGFKGGEGGSGGFALTTSQAVAERAALMHDKGWVQRWNNGDVDARRKMAELNRIIGGG